MDLERVKDYVVDALCENSGLKMLTLELAHTMQDVYKHSENVEKLALMIGLEYGFDLDRLIRLGVGALLHDVGKTQTDRDILYKPDKLTPSEYTVVQAHAVYGYNMLREVTSDDIVLDIALNHHSKLNGSGYPFQMKGSEISIYTQIVTVSDIFDALVSERVYKEPKSNEEAFRILKSTKGINRLVVSILEDGLGKAGGQDEA